MRDASYPLNHTGPPTVVGDISKKMVDLTLSSHWDKHLGAMFRHVALFTHHCDLICTILWISYTPLVFTIDHYIYIYIILFPLPHFVDCYYQFCLLNPKWQVIEFPPLPFFRRYGWLVLHLHKHHALSRSDGAITRTRLWFPSWRWELRHVNRPSLGGFWGFGGSIGSQREDSQTMGGCQQT